MWYIAYSYNDILNATTFSIAVLICCARNSDLRIVSRCVCPGFNVTYECTTVGLGSTVWTLGSASECNVILRHTQFALETAVDTCMDGAVIGTGLRPEDNCYTSTLDVLVSSNLDGRVVQCEHDDGSSTTVIGTVILRLTTGMGMWWVTMKS